MEEIAFTPGSVPVVVVARVYGKRCFSGLCRYYIRAATNWKATRNGKLITNIEGI